VQDDGTSPAAPPRETPPAVSPLSVWDRVRDHKIIQWSVAYLGAALALAQGIELVGRGFAWPEVIDRGLIVLLVVGFPIAVTVAWYHGHRGLQRVSQGELAIVSVLILIGALLFGAVFAPPVEVAARASGSEGLGSATEPPSDRQAPENSIAVLPFANNSSDSEQEYFVDGLSEAVMNQLTKVAALRVTAGTSSFAFKGRTGDIGTIGDQLGVRHVLEGGVLKSGNAVRITVRLSDTATGFQRWSETYNGELGDVFALQDEIARQVARALQASLGIADDELRRGGTHSTAAYEHYLLARSLQRQGDPLQGPRLLEELELALAIDPNFGLAQVNLASLLNLIARASIVVDPELEMERDLAIDRSVVVAPDLPATFALLAQRYSSRGEWAEAEQAWKEVWARSSPNDFDANSGYGGFLNGMGYATEALPYVERARLLDPLVADPYISLSLVYDAIGLRERALATYDEMTSNVPRPSILAIMPQFWRVLTTGDIEGASALLPSSVQDPPDAVLRFGVIVESTLLGDRERGLAALRAGYANPAAGPGALANIAFFAVHFGDTALATEAFGKALKSDSSWLTFAWMPLMEPVRRSARFKEIVREMGLVDYWRASRWPDHCRPLPEGDFECF
jgi:TolB-like protein